MLSRVLPRTFLIILVLSLAGCASYYQPRYGHDGVYYDDPHGYPRHGGQIGYYDPLLYPYWSLDYFYFSRYYHPYSVRIHYYDPWYYPYPGWYYGYRPGPRSSFGLTWDRHYYPWHAYGSSYHHHRPWRPRYVSYPRQAATGAPNIDRVRLIDDRLRHAERRERAAVARAGDDAASGESMPITARRDIQRSRAVSVPRDLRVQRQRSQAEPRTRREAPQPPPRRSQPQQQSSGESAPPRRQRSTPPPTRSSSQPRQRSSSSEPRRSSRSQRREPPATETKNRSRRRN